MNRVKSIIYKTYKLWSILFLLILSLLLTENVSAHDTHFDESKLPFDKFEIILNEYGKGGLMVRTTKGLWLIYKHVGLRHSGLHIIQLETYRIEEERH